jgi:uncharacterized linocin/CFP29 family protein
MSNWLRRDAAPLSEKVWNEIDKIAATMARQTLVGRRIADFDGPHGWNHVGTQLGTFRTVTASKPVGTARLSLPDLMLLTEIRRDFTIPWSAIDVFERVGPTLDSNVIEEAARETALAEDQLVFYGRGDVPGLLTHDETPRVPLSDWSTPGSAVTDLLTAVERLDEIGIKGPYEAVLSPDHYYSYLRTTVGGYPAAKQLGIVIEKVHSSPVVDGAILFSTRGGDFLITVGGDFAVGYRWHDEESVHLFCVETVAAQLLTPRALCLIQPSRTRSAKRTR